MFIQYVMIFMKEKVSYLENKNKKKVTWNVIVLNVHIQF